MFRKIFADIIPPNLNLNQRNIMVNCPFHGDTNASFAISTDPSKPVYHCFGCGKKGSWIGYYMETRGVSYPQALEELGMDNPKPAGQYTPPPPPPPKPVIDYWGEVSSYQDKIINNPEIYAKKLFELRGLCYPSALACFVGFSEEKGWIFPVFRYPDTKCVGYEVRHAEFKKFINPASQKETKCYKAKDTPSCLCYINQGDKDKCYVVEGFPDGYFLHQYFLERKPPNEIGRFIVNQTILSPSCGVSHLPELIREHPLDEYKEVIFVLDNDEAGNKAKDQIMALSPRYKFFSGLKEGQDFEDYYKSIAKSGNV